jgi:hypothetical protein
MALTSIGLDALPQPSPAGPRPWLSIGADGPMRAAAVPRHPLFKNPPWRERRAGHSPFDLALRNTRLRMPAVYSSTHEIYFSLIAWLRAPPRRWSPTRWRTKRETSSTSTIDTGTALITKANRSPPRSQKLLHFGILRRPMLSFSCGRSGINRPLVRSFAESGKLKGANR